MNNNLKITNDLNTEKKLYQELFSNKLYKELIKLNTFQRLKKISFLGTLEFFRYDKKQKKYIKKKENKFNRYEHTINVALLSLYHAKREKLSEKDINEVVIAALLHDIGHISFSHSTENGFIKKFNIGHYKKGLNLITGKDKNKEIFNYLKENKINIENIVNLLKKKEKKEENNVDIKYFILNNPFKADMIEGTFRAYYFYKNKPLDFKMLDVIKALINKDTKILDKFWKLNQKVYNEFINEENIQKIDFLTEKFVLEFIEEESDINLNDKEFDKKYNLLNYINDNINKFKIEKEKLRKKDYIVNNNYEIKDFYNINELYKRYNIKKRRNIQQKIENNNITFTN